MTLGRDHEIVGDASGCCGFEDGMVRFAISFDLVERNGTVADGVHVEIQTAKVVEDKVSNGIGSLDGKVEVIPGIEEPRVFVRDEVAGGLVCPVLSFC